MIELILRAFVGAAEGIWGKRMFGNFKSAKVRREVQPFGRMAWDKELGWWQGAVWVPMFQRRLVVQVASEPPDTVDAPIAGDITAAALAFLALKPSKLEEVSPHAWLNYREFAHAVGEESIIKIPPKRNIWKHVKAIEFEVERRDEDERVYVSIRCECDWEIEHGLQLVLQDGVRWARVSEFSGHLTEGDACSTPALDEWLKDSDATLPVRTGGEVYALAHGKKDEWDT